MSDDKLKQNHVFVKNNVGSLALHKAKQEIGGIKMDCNELNRTFFTGQYCNCGGEYWSTMYVGFNVPNAKCKKCGSETTLCPTQRLHIKKNILRGRDE